MKKKKLEMILEGVKGFSAPNVRKEQYDTPAPIAAEMLHLAYMQGDLSGIVFDLGCGTGILAIGAKLLGAEKVIGVDSDLEALKIARENAERTGVEICLICCDVKDFTVRCHADLISAVVMNPPFGAQRRGCDRPFLRKALEIGDVVYSLHNAGSENFINKFIRKQGIITHKRSIDFPMKWAFRFHKKDIKIVNIDLYRFERRKRNVKSKGKFCHTRGLSGNF
ncbi:MAG: methyltransferase [Methanocellales archaeon]|nr:methyltransferase [Methanocellales archaeon]